jgi:hypothetical protein
VSTVSVSIDRSSLSLAALVATDDGATYQIQQDGISRPAITWRKLAAPDSADVHGTEYIAAVKEQTSIPLNVIVKSASTSALQMAIDDIEAAISQFSYSVTVTVDGAAKTWAASPAAWSFSTPITPGQVAQFFTLMTITIPVYPIAS